MVICVWWKIFFLIQRDIYLLSRKVNFKQLRWKLLKAAISTYVTVLQLSLNILHTSCYISNSERSFSTLSRMKTWLSTIILREWLIGLALLHTQHHIEVTAEEVIARFSELGVHRFVLWYAISYEVYSLQLTIENIHT